MSTSDLSQQAPAPKCGRCFRAVDSAMATPVIEKGVLVGYSVTYQCHGESKTFGVSKKWLDEPGNESRPFVDEVFEPVAMKQLTAQDLADVEYKSKLRTARLEVIKKTIDHMTALAKELGHESADELINNRTVEIKMPVKHLLGIGIQAIDPAPARYNVYVDGTYRGNFEFPFYPDQQEVTWNPIKTV